MKAIETERLLLEMWKESDAAGCYKYASNPNVGPAAGWKPHDNVEESLEIIRTLFIPNEVWAIKDKETREIIGSIGLEKDNRREGVNSRELGYALGEEYWGKGLMTEAAKAVIDFAFTELKLDILSIQTSPINKRSQGVIKKCGFTYEGTLRKTYHIFDGTDRDSLCYSMLREEWDKA